MNYFYDWLSFDLQIYIFNLIPTLRPQERINYAIMY